MSPVVEFLQEEQTQGRRLILPMAANHRIAEAVACQLGLFDVVIAVTVFIIRRGVQAQGNA